MKKIAIIILILTVLTTGCSYEITTKNSQELQGENEHWEVEYKINFITSYPRKDGKIYARQAEEHNIKVSYKKDPDNLAAVKHIEILYKDSFGNGGHRIEDFDSPPTKRQFRLGGGSATTYELGDNLKSPVNLHKSMILYSNPDAELSRKGSATITIQLDKVTETIQLFPVEGASPIHAFVQQIFQRQSLLEEI